ncbi:hypothetical protein ACWFQ8_14100 [Streptomyces sp. NPDC055254]
MADEPDTMPIQSLYAQRFASDLETNRKEQEDVSARIAELEVRLEQLKADENWLSGLQGALPGTTAGGAAAESTDSVEAGPARSALPGSVPRPRRGKRTGGGTTSGRKAARPAAQSSADTPAEVPGTGTAEVPVPAAAPAARVGGRGARSGTPVARRPAKAAARKTAPHTAVRKTAAGHAAAQEPAVREAAVQDTAARDTGVHEAGAHEAGAQKTAAQDTAVHVTAAPEAPAREAGARDTAVRDTAAPKSAASKSAEPKASGRKRPPAKSTAEKPAAEKPAGTASGRTGEPPLRELVLALLVGAAEPRMVSEVAAELTAAHADRATSTPVVRNTLEGLAKKGVIEKEHRQGSVMYTAPQPSVKEAAATPVPDAAGTKTPVRA